MYAEMNMLVSAIARELGLSLEDAVQGLETGEISVAMGEEGNGERYLALNYRDQAARVHQSALGMVGGCSSCEGACEDGLEDDEADACGCGAGHPHG